MMPLRLRARLVVLIVAGIVPLFALSIIQAMNSADEAIKHAGINLEFAASLAAAGQQSTADSVRQVLTAVASLPRMQDDNDRQCNNYFASLLKRLPEYANMGIVDLDGYSRCHGLDGDKSIFLGDRSYFREAVAQRRFVVGVYAVDQWVGAPVITFSMPVMNPADKMTGVIFVSIGMAQMAKSIEGLQLPPGAALGIKDREGTLLAGRPTLPIQVGQKTLNPMLQEVVRNKIRGVREGPNGSGEDRLWAFLPSSPNTEAAVFISASLPRQLVVGPSLKKLRLDLTVMGLMTVLGGLLAWLWVGRSVIRSTDDLLQATREIQKGQLGMRLHLASREKCGEFFRIAASFNRMAESLQAERCALEAELTRSQAVQEKLRDAQRLARMGYWQVDVKSTDFTWSDEIPVLLGIDRTGRSSRFDGLMDCIVAADRENFQAAKATFLHANGPLNTEFRVLTPAGDVRWMHIFSQRHGDGPEAGFSRSGVIQDITLRKQSEQALIDSEQRYAALFELAPVAMWVYDIQSLHFVAVNKMTMDVYGYSRAEFLTMSIFDIRPLAEGDRLKQHLLEDSFADPEAWVHCRKDGSLFDVQIVSQAIQYEGRAARFVVGLDVTAKVSAEFKVQEHLLTLQRAAHAAQAITWQRTLQGTMQAVAEQVRTVVGAHLAIVSLSACAGDTPTINARSVSEEYAYSPTFRVVGEGAELCAFVAQRNAALRLTTEELQAHPAWQHTGGSPDRLPLRGWLAAPLMARNGMNIGVLQLFDKQQGQFTKQDEYVAIELAQLASAAMENASLLDEVGRLNASLEQKVAERTAALALQEALFRALTEQAPQLVWTADAKGRVTYFNRACFDLLGGEMSDWVGTQWFSIIHPEDLPGVRAGWQVASAQHSQFTGERRLRDKDGCYHTMSYRASPVFAEDGQVAFWIGIDANITVMKATETALRLSNQELEAFSYSVSHDLRAPLNTVDGFSRLLARQLANQTEGVGAEKVQHYLSRIQAGVRQMGQLIEDLLSLAHVARAQLRSGPVDLSALARGIMQEWHAAEPERTIKVSIQDGLLTQGDSRLIKVVLANLLGNAWKFTTQQADPHISMGRFTDVAGVGVFFVRDNGVGFDMAYADKLFIPFQRLHAVTDFAGTGIGLATVRRVVERHGGRIWPHAEPGAGATFFFTLPEVPQITGMA